MKYIGYATAILFVLFSAAPLFCQSPAHLKHTVVKTDRYDFGAGGTITITGAPTGAIKVVGTGANEIEVTATIELEAASASDLAKLAEITGFVTQEGAIRSMISSIGPHNKFGLKKLPKKFPAHLLKLPFRIDYVITVPRYSNLEIDGGKGDLSVSGVEGSMEINFLETDGRVETGSGTTMITIGTGTLDADFGVRGWRGRSANIAVGTGRLNVRLPSTTSAEIDAIIVKTGSIENLLPDLKPRDRKVPFSEKSVIAKAGVGGSPLKFTVGDGSIKLELLSLPR
ncbi:MAG: hypothetical protein AB7J13_00510 [Pyrinomonadaceae bacterium]